MRHSPTWRGSIRPAWVGTLAVVLVALAGCGGSEAAGEKPRPSSSASATQDGDTYDHDTTFSGDDLLAADVRSVEIPGTDSSITYRFPADFTPDGATETSAKGPDDESYVGVSADLDTDLATAVREVKSRSSRYPSRSSDVTVNGEDGIALAVDLDGDRTVLGVYFAIDDTTVVAVQYGTYLPDEQPTPETVEAFNQMVGSVKLVSGGAG